MRFSNIVNSRSLPLSFGSSAADTTVLKSIVLSFLSFSNLFLMIMKTIKPKLLLKIIMSAQIL